MLVQIEPPAEFDPVELLFLAQNKLGIARKDFATVLGVNPDTLGHWAARSKNPGKAWKIRAADLKKQWQI